MFVNCWGEEKVKMFFRCGVDGVRLATERDVVSFRGGVLALESLLTVRELVDGWNEGSGDRVGGVGWDWGIVDSNSSLRSTVE